ncbi:hypothetical protein [Pacificoceanicola onchidii]|uniref:hypothetical protein n=1 Tax=Pacificoceanicola onchidii TaxID=2562685 RepID=UPI0010A2CECE|nr:hypothetical protein [Pacificoceanicola onchidii]
MDPDTTLVVGMVLAVLAIPAIVSAFSDGRAPRVAAMVAILAGGLMVYAIQQKEGGYRFGDLPSVVYRVIGDLI